MFFVTFLSNNLRDDDEPSKHVNTLWVKKLDPFSFEHIVGKYCPILIIISLLQTEINCVQVYILKFATKPQICKCTTL